MTLAGLMNQVCVVTRRTETGSDAYNNPVPSEASTTTTCYAEQVVASESDEQASDVRDETWNVWLPAGTDVEGVDEVTIDGVPMEVVGPPWTVHNPRLGTSSHIRLSARRTV